MPKERIKIKLTRHTSVQETAHAHIDVFPPYDTAEILKYVEKHKFKEFLIVKRDYIDGEDWELVED